MDFLDMLDQFWKARFKGFEILKNIRGVPLKKSEKNSSEDRSFFDDLKIFEAIFLWRPPTDFFQISIFALWGT